MKDSLSVRNAAVTDAEQKAARHPSPPPDYVPLRKSNLPLPNYSLSTVCPGCGHETIRLACKVRCQRCGFMWDCSEL
ncbi:hypothetical protein QQ056_10950 [Oscillatoria laete-virens NRMC-F 0139]|nr:hypothetical protein [Oscillatoria laete-virens]MDL5054057.1 hypothetical protein [Oscillatoria laete-virens NRMC-F 0139]